LRHTPIRIKRQPDNSLHTGSPVREPVTFSAALPALHIRKNPVKLAFVCITPTAFMPVSQVFDRALQRALQLDLFSDLVTAPRTPVREPLATQPPPQQPLPPVAPTATTLRTTEPETPPPSLRTRQLRCGDQLIAYTLTRSSRRSIGLAIRDAQLHITAPRWVTITAVEEAIIAKRLDSEQDYRTKTGRHVSAKRSSGMMVRCCHSWGLPCNYALCRNASASR
jgi:hypothetical protein